MNEPIIIKELGLIYGRDAIHLDEVAFEKGFNNVKLIGVFDGVLCENIKKDEWIKYTIIFKDIIDFRIVKENYFDDSEYTSSFEKILKSEKNKWKNHYIFHTYDDIFEIIASEFEIILNNDT